VAEADEPLMPAEAIKAKIAAAAARIKGGVTRDPVKQRRSAEQKQRKDRVNPSLLRNGSQGHDETWTIRAKPSQIKAVKRLADELSQPGAKVSIASLMDEAIDLLIAKYQETAPDA
jgi:hypothetical protein